MTYPRAAFVCSAATPVVSAFTSVFSAPSKERMMSNGIQRMRNLSEPCEDITSPHIWFALCSRILIAGRGTHVAQSGHRDSQNRPLVPVLQPLVTYPAT